MGKTYRAKQDSYGFRGQHWQKGDIAEDVVDSEKINEHFELVSAGVKAEPPKNPAFEPREPSTLSEIQDGQKKAKPVRK